MKNFLIAIITLFAFSANAQFKSEFRLTDPDTSAQSETNYIYIGGTSWATATAFVDPGELLIVVQTDSLSGATDGTVTIEGACDTDGTIVSPALGSLTTNGAASQFLVFEDLNAVYLKYRIKIVNESGTQSNKTQAAWAFKRAK